MQRAMPTRIRPTMSGPTARRAEQAGATKPKNRARVNIRIGPTTQFCTSDRPRTLVIGEDLAAAPRNFTLASGGYIMRIRPSGDQQVGVSPTVSTALKRWNSGLEQVPEADAERHGEEDPDRQVAVEQGQPCWKTLVHVAVVSPGVRCGGTPGRCQEPLAETLDCGAISSRTRSGIGPGSPPGPRRDRRDPAVASAVGGQSRGRRGQTSSAQRVITMSTVARSISSTDFERWPEASMPISASASIASGWTRDGAEPALWMRRRPPDERPGDSLRHLAARGVGDAKEERPRGSRRDRLADVDPPPGRARPRRSSRSESGAGGRRPPGPRRRPGPGRTGRAAVGSSAAVAPSSRSR